MGPSRRENTIREVEKFLQDSAEELPPMREFAKEPVCIKERVEVRNGVVFRYVDDGSKMRTVIRKLPGSSQSMRAGSKKSAEDMRMTGEDAAASTADSGTSGEYKAESAANKSKPVSAEKSAADRQTFGKHTALLITALHNSEEHSAESKVGNASFFKGSKLLQNMVTPSPPNKESSDRLPSMGNRNPTSLSGKHKYNHDQLEGDSTRSLADKSATDPKNNLLTRREPVSEPLCIKQHYIRRAGYTGLRDTTMYPNAIPYQWPRQDHDTDSAQQNRQAPRRLRTHDHHAVTVNSRPHQQPYQHPGSSSNQEPPDQADGHRTRHPGNPRNIHQYVNYDNCTENVVDVDRNEQDSTSS